MKISNILILIGLVAGTSAQAQNRVGTTVSPSTTNTGPSTTPSSPSTTPSSPSTLGNMPSTTGNGAIPGNSQNNRGTARAGTTSPTMGIGTTSR